MFPKLTLISMGGHRYDPRVLAAPMEYVHARSCIAAGKSTGRDVSYLGLLSEELAEILLARDRGVHTTIEERPEGAVCACGLVVPVGVPMSRATGHLDLRTWDPASTIVVSDAPQSGPWGAEYVGCRAYCQACGWLDAVKDRYDAAGAGDYHRCGARSASREVGRT